MPAACLPTGRTSTTPVAHTVRSPICRRHLTQSSQRPTCNGTGRCAMSRAPRPVPLHHRATQAQMTQGLYLSLDERLGSGQREETLPVSNVVSVEKCLSSNENREGMRLNLHP